MCVILDVCGNAFDTLYLPYRPQAKPSVEETSLASSAMSDDPWACDEATGVPPLFLSGCVGNVSLAREKWARTREWRRKFEIDQVRQDILYVYSD